MSSKVDFIWKSSSPTFKLYDYAIYYLSKYVSLVPTWKNNALSDKSHGLLRIFKSGKLGERSKKFTFCIVGTHYNHCF